MIVVPTFSMMGLVDSTEWRRWSEESMADLILLAACVAAGIYEPATAEMR